MADSKATVQFGTTGIAGAVVGYMAGPDGFVVVKWLASYLGAVGFVMILGVVAAIGGLLMMWTRLKEKDTECQNEAQRLRESWKSVVDQMSADNKESIQNVSDLIRQVTILTERTAGQSMKVRGD